MQTNKNTLMQTKIFGAHKLILASIFLLIFLLACSDASQKKAQSINNGLALFKTNCSACHQDSGEGIAQLYPPLKGSDYIKKDPNRVACIIHKGLNGDIMVNGKKFNQMMPANANLSAEEVADISNFVLNNFNQLDTYLSPEGVQNIFATCK